MAKRRWQLAQIEGEGPWGVLISCVPNRAVRLFATKAEAVLHLDDINLDTCTHYSCRRAFGHKLFHLEVADPPRDSFKIPGDWAD
jgi:hypothetical protein